MLTYGLFLIGVVLLVKGADWLIDGSVALAKRLHLSPFFIGLTVVAFGTSTPELIVSAMAAFRGSGDIVLSNILGSNTANILLVFGLSAAVFPLTVKVETAWREIPLGVVAASLLGVLGSDGSLDQIEGAFLLACFMGFLAATLNTRRAGAEPSDQNERRRAPLVATVAKVIGGLTGLVVGGSLVVDGAVALARAFGVSNALVGLTVVAVGTSLPELVTSVVAAYRKNPDIAVGNIVGSNIFNVLFILGFAGLLKPMVVYPQFREDVAATVAASVLLFIMMFLGRWYLIERWQGILLLLSYLGYVGYRIALEVAQP